MPASVVYGHAAARGLDINRWSFGLDTGCVSCIRALEACRCSLIHPQTVLWSEIDSVGIRSSSSPRFFNPTRRRRRGRDRHTQSKRRNTGDIRSVTTAQIQIWGQWASSQGFHRRCRLFELISYFIASHPRGQAAKPFNLFRILSLFCFRICFSPIQLYYTPARVKGTYHSAHAFNLSPRCLFSCSPLVPL